MGHLNRTQTSLHEGYTDHMTPSTYLHQDRLILPPRNVSLEKWFNSIKENEDEEQAETRAVHTGV